MRIKLTHACKAFKTVPNSLTVVVIIGIVTVLLLLRQESMRCILEIILSRRSKFLECWHSRANLVFEKQAQRLPAPGLQDKSGGPHHGPLERRDKKPASHPVSLAVFGLPKQIPH